MLGPPDNSRRVITVGGPKHRDGDVTAAPAPAPSPQAVRQCSDGDQSVISGTMQSADTQRHVVVSFMNVSSHPCTLFGYPGADLVTPVGGVLINVPRRPAAAAHRLTLAPNDVAHADIQSYAIDTSTGNDCARWGTVVVTPPNDVQSHTERRSAHLQRLDQLGRLKRVSCEPPSMDC